MKFNVLNRVNGNVQFIVNIDCEESTSQPIKLGLSVKWAIENKANLRDAKLCKVNLCRANLSGTDFSGADFSGANLDGADFSGANLRRANLDGANSGINDFLKSIQIETYYICYTCEVIQIGCEKHSIEDWRTFDDQRIIEMDGKSSLKFWRKYKDFIFQAIELAPAKSTNRGN